MRLFLDTEIPVSRDAAACGQKDSEFLSDAAELTPLYAVRFWNKAFFFGIFLTANEVVSRYHKRTSNQQGSLSEFPVLSGRGNCRTIPYCSCRIHGKRSMSAGASGRTARSLPGPREQRPHLRACSKSNPATETVTGPALAPGQNRISKLRQKFCPAHRGQSRTGRRPRWTPTRYCRQYS